MYRNLLSWLTVLLVLPSCSGTSPAISVVCEENNVGNCIIKWETAPVLKGIPAYLIISHDGKLQGRYVGFPGVDVLQKDLIRAIEE